MQPIRAISLLTCLIYLQIFSLNCAGQSSPFVNIAIKSAGDSTEFIIQRIRKEYASINADSAKYRVSSKNVFDMSTEGGEIKNYFEGEILRKSVVMFFGEIGKSYSEYYFSNNKIFFCYERISSYNKPMYIKDLHILKVEENRYYFENQKLIRWLDNSKKVVAKTLYADKEKKLLSIWKEANQKAE